MSKIISDAVLNWYNNSYTPSINTDTTMQQRTPFWKKFGSTLGDVGSIAGGVMGGPLGWLQLGAQVVGDNISAARSQFDLTGAKRSMSDYAGNIFNAASQADNTSDILGLSSMYDDSTFLDDINSQGYKWDGNLLGGIGAIIGSAKTERDKQAARDYLTGIQSQQDTALSNAVNTVGQKNYRRGMANYLNMAAMGGPLSTHGSDFSDNLIRIDTGGTHESNPLGGVPAGVDPYGIPNLVEEGEVIWDKDDYVFSDRLKMPKGLVNKYKLGGKKNKSMTFAEGVKKVSEILGTELRPNDPITQRTQDAILEDLEGAQEEKRMDLEKKNLIKALSELSPEEFASLMSPSPETQGMQAVPQQEEINPTINSMGTEMPPQGMNEEQMVQAPVQEAGAYEPVGISGFALGGHTHVLSGKNGESRRTTTKRSTSELVGPRRLPGVGVIAYDNYNYGNTIPIEPDADGKHWWVGGTNGVGRRVNSEAEAQRVARQMANARAALNMSGDLDNAVIGAESKQLNVPQTRAASNRGIVTKDTTFNTPYLNIEYPFNGQNIPDDEYDNSGRFLPNDYASFYGRIHAPGRNPGWGVLARGVPQEEAVQEAVSTQNTPSSSTPRRGTPSTVGVVSGVRSTPKESEWTPNKIFSVSTVNPFDQWRARSPLFNVTTPRTAAQKAIEGTAPTDAENTVSVGAQDSGVLPTWMRYAPIIGGGLSVLSDAFYNPDYSGAESLLSASRRLSNPISIPVTTIGDRIRRNPFDERLAVNQANQNYLAGLRSTLDTAGGNRAFRQYATSSLARGNQGALSDIARNSYLANRQDALQTADFDRGTNLYNMNAINQRNLTQAQLNNNRDYAGFNARLQAQGYLDNMRRYDDQLASADMTAFLQNLGNLGRENFIFNQVDARNREGLSPVGYTRDKSGNWVFSGFGEGGKKKTTKKRRF